MKKKISFDQALQQDGVVVCKHKVVISPKVKDDPTDTWTVIIKNIVPHEPKKDFSVVVAWHKTRASARAQVKLLRQVLNTSAK